MSATILVLSEVAVGTAERQAVADLLGGDEAVVKILIPRHPQRHLVADFLDHLSLLEFGKAIEGLTEGQGDEAADHQAAQAALEASLTAFADLGTRVEGILVDGDPVQALIEHASGDDATQAVVVTLPHAVADTLHTDWANQAQRKLGIPVLHLYAGTGFIGDS